MITQENINSALAEINKDVHKTGDIQTGVTPDGNGYLHFSYTFTWTDAEKSKAYIDRAIEMKRSLSEYPY